MELVNNCSLVTVKFPYDIRIKPGSSILCKNLQKFVLCAVSMLYRCKSICISIDTLLGLGLDKDPAPKSRSPDEAPLNRFFLAVSGNRCGLD
jgi:hypothetical protein